MFQLPCNIFILINKVKRFSKHFRRTFFFFFFVDSSIIDAKLFFEVPTQPDMIDDTARPVSTYMLTLREIFSNEFGKNSIMVWTGNESQTGLIKTNNCSTKISFITKLYIYT